LLAFLLPVSAGSQRVQFPPQLQRGQTLIYQLEFDGLRGTKVESQVTAPESSSTMNLNASCLLQINVVEVEASGVRLKTYLSERKVSRSPDSSNTQNSAPDKLVEVFIGPDGSASRVKGLEQLSPAQRFAWNSWLGRFTSSMTYPKLGARVGQRWEVTEPEDSPSPMAGLFWKKNLQYVRDEPCDAAGNTSRSPQAGPMCAVVFVRAALHQKPSPKNTTPQDFKLRSLATRGTASGSNETILVISRATGLLVRSSEDTQQTMDLTIALADGSNQVRYLINAKSHSQIQLLPDVPQDVR